MSTAMHTPSEPVEQLLDTDSGALSLLPHPAELEAAAAIAPPAGWPWMAAALLAAAIAVSALFPWGFA